MVFYYAIKCFNLDLNVLLLLINEKKFFLFEDDFYQKFLDIANKVFHIKEGHLCNIPYFANKKLGRLTKSMFEDVLHQVFHNVINKLFCIS